MHARDKNRLTQRAGGGKVQAARQGAQATRMRSCEEGMLSSSRYLATVRRATGTPAAFRFSARRASDSGLRGFSASTRRLIISWMAMLDASPPPSVPMPEAKKARSGLVPRGVRTYLREIAREIRSEERRVGTECVSPCRSWCAPASEKKKILQ